MQTEMLNPTWEILLLILFKITKYSFPKSCLYKVSLKFPNRVHLGIYSDIQLQVLCRTFKESKQTNEVLGNIRESVQPDSTEGTEVFYPNIDDCIKYLQFTVQTLAFQHEVISALVQCPIAPQVVAG